MCHATTCRRCGRTTWSGCGRHVDQVMATVQPADRCPGHEQARGSDDGRFTRLVRAIARR